MKKILIIVLIVILFLLLSLSPMRLHFAIQRALDEGDEILSKEDTDDFVIVTILSDQNKKTFLVDKSDYSVLYVNSLVDENLRRCLENE